jgi:hypothetical protein
MLRALAVVALALGPGACVEREPTFDASSVQAYSASFQRINDRLSLEQRQALRKALLTLAATPAGAGSGEDAITREFLEFALVASPALAAGWVVTSLGDQIDGKTARQVIRRANETELARLEGQLARLEQRLAALPDEIAEAERGTTNHAGALRAVTVAAASYGWSEDAFAGEPLIEFRLTNGLEAGIRRAVFRAVLTSPGRRAPWVDESFERRFRPALAPGAAERVRLSPSRFGAWSDLALRDRPDAELSVRVVELETTAGERLLASGRSAPDRLQRKLEQLQASQERLRRRVERLRAALADAT